MLGVNELDATEIIEGHVLAAAESVNDVGLGLTSEDSEQTWGQFFIRGAERFVELLLGGGTEVY